MSNLRFPNQIFVVFQYPPIFLLDFTEFLYRDTNLIYCKHLNEFKKLILFIDLSCWV